MPIKLNRDFTDIEFFEVKSKLKEFMQNQDEFKDYNFEGSNINALMDMLSYTMHQLLFYLNTSINEFFLEYTTSKENGITLAKSLGYSARRKISASGSVVITPGSKITPDTEDYKIFIPAYTKIKSDNKNFITMEDKEIGIVNFVSPTEFEWVTPQIIIKEGDLKELTYTVSDTEGSIITINENADEIENYFLEVRVNGEKYVRDIEVLDYIDANSKIYFLTRISNKLRISFGDGILGRAVESGDVVTIFYLKSSGSEGNNPTNLELNEMLRNTTGSMHLASEFSLSVTSIPAGGFDEETLDSIKVNAPKSFAAQNRAVTQDDFQVVIESAGYNANVWGGNEEFELYEIPEINSSDYTDLGITAEELDFFVAGFNPPYFERANINTYEIGDFLSEVNDDMIWQLKYIDPSSELPAPLEDVTSTYWQLTHKPKIGYVFFCGFNVNSEGEKIQYTSQDINTFKTFMKDYKIITLKMLPYNPNIIHYDLTINVKRTNNFIGNTQELLNKLRDSVVTYFNTKFVGFNNEFVKSQLIDNIMDNENIRYAIINYNTFTQLFKPYQELDRLVVRLYNKIDSGTIKIYDENNILVAYDNTGKIYYREYDESDVEVYTDYEVPSRIDYDNGIIEFKLDVAGSGVELDFDNNKYIMNFEFSYKEYQKILKENYINSLTTAAVNYTV